MEIEDYNKSQRPYWEQLFNPSEEDKKLTDEELKAKVCRLTENQLYIDNILRNSPNPWAVDLINPTDEPKKVVLFGANNFLSSENYGCEEGVQITTPCSHLSYEQILNHLKLQPNKIGLIRLISDNKNQLKEDLTIVKNSTEENFDETIIKTKEHMNPTSFQSKINEIRYQYEQDGNTHIAFNLLPKTTLRFRLYSDCELNIKENQPKYPADLIPLAISNKSQRLTRSPFQICITNKTNEVKRAVLFNFDENYNKENYGSDIGIKVSPSPQNVTYAKILSESAFKPFITSFIRLQSTNSDQIHSILDYNQKEANGQEVGLSIFTESYFSSHQFQSGIIDIPIELDINNISELSFNILPKTTLVVTLFAAFKPTELEIIQHNLDKHKSDFNALMDRVKKIENKKWWHFFFPQK